MLKLSIIHLGHQLLTSLAKAECKNGVEGLGGEPGVSRRAICGSQSHIILPVILSSEDQGVKLLKWGGWSLWFHHAQLSFISETGNPSENFRLLFKYQ